MGAPQPTGDPSEPTGPLILSRELRENYNLKGLPAWAREWRENQPESVEAAVDHFRSGGRFFMLQAPVGFGKSIAAECIRRELGEAALYLVNTIQLEDQLIDPTRGFPYARNIHGREHYPTQNFPEKFRLPESKWAQRITCGDCDKSGNDSCSFCEDEFSCPYTMAKKGALGSRLTVTNYSYGIAEMNSVGGFSNREATETRKLSGLIVADEVDSLEHVLMGQVETTISPRRQQQLGIEKPGIKTRSAQKAQSAWETWAAEEAYPKVSAALQTVRAKIRMDQGRGVPPVALYKERQYLERLLDRLKILIAELPAGGWVYDYVSGREESANSPITFKPIRVSKFGESLLWRHAQYHLLMSATILSPQRMADDLGIDEEPGWKDVPSTFPVENRPIRIAPIANMTHQTRDEELPKAVAGIRIILDRYHPDDRVLVHTVSRQNSIDVARMLDSRRIIMYESADKRVAALEEFKRTPGAVLLAQSYTRGADLPEDLCRATITMKVPYPSKGDKQIDARLNEEGRRLEGSEWYSTLAIREICQSVGRGVRSETDSATAYILDSQFSKLYRQNQSLFPKWFRDAMVWHGPWRREIETAVSAANRQSQ